MIKLVFVFLRCKDTASQKPILGLGWFRWEKVVSEGFGGFRAAYIFIYMYYFCMQSEREEVTFV